jgi:hypothetical protein
MAGVAVLTFREPSAGPSVIGDVELTELSKSISGSDGTGSRAGSVMGGQRRRSSASGTQRRHSSITFPVGFASVVANPIGSIEETGAAGSLLHRFMHEEDSADGGRVRRFSILPPVGSVLSNRLSAIADDDELGGDDR